MTSKKKYDSNFTARGLIHFEFDSLFEFSGGENVEEIVKS